VALLNAGQPVQRGAPLRAALALFASDQAEGWTAGACLLGLIAALGGRSQMRLLANAITCGTSGDQIALVLQLVSARKRCKGSSVC
jgi:hypothetical protein